MTKKIIQKKSYKKTAIKSVKGGGYGIVGKYGIRASYGKYPACVRKCGGEENNDCIRNCMY